MNNLQTAQIAYDNRQPEEYADFLYTGVIQLWRTDCPFIEVDSIKVEFKEGQYVKVMLTDCITGDDHVLPANLYNCIGEFDAYLEHAIDMAKWLEEKR